MQLPKFVHLHCHSDYSFLDGLITLQQYSSYIQKTGNKIAITQHGNLCSAGQMIASKKNNWILGLEAYRVDNYDQQSKKHPYHILLLRKTVEGWYNLVKINNIACDNFYKKPQIAFDDLVKHKQGILVSSACQGNRIAQFVLADNLEAARSFAIKCKQSFEHFYLQLQYGTSEARPKINQAFIQMSKQLNIPCIVTNDVHLNRPQDRHSKQVLRFISYGKKPQKTYQCDKNLFLRDAEQLISRVPQQQKQFVRQAMRNTVKIAYQIIDQQLISKIDVSIKLPQVDTSGMVKDAVNNLKAMGLQQKTFQKYLQRLKYQLAVINKIGVMGYFKVVQQAVKLAELNNTYSGAGRGSARSSLFLYLLGVTCIDPLKYNLMFERFLNPSLKIKSAEDLPDIDMDFQDPDKLRQLLKQKYGQKNVAQGATYSSYSMKILLKDILKFYDAPFQVANKATALLDIIQSDIKKNAQDKAPDFSLPVIKQYPQFQQVFKRFPKALQPFETLYKRKRHIGRHAGAVVYLQSLANKIPQYRSHGEVITAWGQAGGNLKTLSKNGFVKFDFLGLKTLRIIHRAVDLIKKNYNKDIDYRKIPLQDPRVYQNTFNRNKYVGIFQFSSKGMRGLCQQVAPKNVQDISAIISLFRPACLKSGFHEQYLKNRQVGQPRYLHKFIQQILSPTFGTIIYQQQVFQLVKKIGGYSDQDVALFKKYILKVGARKKYADYNQQIKIFKVKFIEYAVSQLKLVRRQVQYLYQQIVRFASYGFCFSGNVKIKMSDNSYKKIKDIKVGDKVLCYNKNQIKQTIVRNKFDNGLKNVYKIKTKNGKVIQGVTLQHKFVCSDGVKRQLKQIIQKNCKILNIDQV